MVDDPNQKEPLKIYLDDQDEPFKVEQAPLRFNFNTIHLSDGDHRLRIVASNGLAPPTEKVIPFTVRNGVAVTCSGLEPNQTIGGQVELIVNAYAGSSEVDFEPRKAETPEPIPTWAWVLFLGVIAWTMFYLLNPSEAVDAYATPLQPEAQVGSRIYTDTCARCHGETGDGQPFEGGGFGVPPLRDNTSYALDDSPLALLSTVILGREGTMMPTWGPVLSNEEIVAVVNHVRTAWRHDASRIELDHRKPPPAVEDLENAFARAVTKRKPKAADILDLYVTDKGGPPMLYRTDGVRAESRAELDDAWESYLLDLGPEGRITQFKLTERRYDYDRETVADGTQAIVISVGRIFVEAIGQAKQRVSGNGRYIRVYEKRDGAWKVLMDFADIPMRVGCDPADPDCPVETPDVGPENGGSTTPSDVDPQRVSYADVQRVLKDWGYTAPNSPHGNFWELPYDQFMALRFPTERGGDMELAYIQLVVSGDAENSNLIRAFEGRPVIVTLPGEGSTYEDEGIPRMPKNKPPIPAKDLALIRAWVDAGCPETPAGAGGPVVPDNGEPPPAPVASAGDAWGYADVKRALAGLGYNSARAPHGHFWELSHAEFVALRFPTERGGDLDVAYIQLVVPGDAENSNLIRAFEGRPVIVSVPEDGSTYEDESIERMPKNKPPLDAALIQSLRAWVDAGCPEVAGGAAAGGPAGDGEAGTAPTEDTGAGETTPGEVPVIDIGYAEIRKILGGLGKRPTTVPHGVFWDLPYREFVGFKVYREWGEEDRWFPLLTPWDAANSNLVKVLKDGKDVLFVHEDGRTELVDLPRMPKNGKPIDPAALAQVVRWIDAGCPEHAGKPTAVRQDGTLPDE